MKSFTLVSWEWIYFSFNAIQSWSIKLSVLQNVCGAIKSKAQQSDLYAALRLRHKNLLSKRNIFASNF